MLRELEVWSVGVRKELHLTWEVWSESVVTAQLATQPSLSNGRLTRSSFLPVPLRTLSWSHWICKLLSIGCPFSQYLFYQYMGGERSSLLLVSSLVSFFKVLNFSLKRSFTYMYVCVPFGCLVQVERPEGGIGHPETGVTWLWAIMRVLGTESRSFGRATSALKLVSHLSSPAPVSVIRCAFLEDLL